MYCPFSGIIIDMIILVKGSLLNGFPFIPFKYVALDLVVIYVVVTLQRIKYKWKKSSPPTKRM